MPVIYIDVVWLINFVMDGVLLLVTGWIMKRPLQFKRLLLGALIGASYSMLLFFPPLAPLTSWIGKAIASLLIVASSFHRRSWLDLARLCLAFYFVSFVFAGAAIALHFAIPGESITKLGVVGVHRVAVETSIGSLSLLMAIPLSLALLKYLLRRLRQVHLRAGMEYQVTAWIHGHTVQFTGLVDSGNQLRDPISRRPVCFVDVDVVQPFLPATIQSVLQKSGNLVEALCEITDPDWQAKFALIPFRGAGGQQQITIGFSPDRVTLAREGDVQDVGCACLFALHPTHLSADGRFQAILHMELITGDEKFETANRPKDVESKIAHSPAASLDSSPH